MIVSVHNSWQLPGGRAARHRNVATHGPGLGFRLQARRVDLDPNPTGWSGGGGQGIGQRA